MSWLRRRIVLGAPHCTLWVEGGFHEDVLRFRFWPSWYITREEIEDTQ